MLVAAIMYSAGIVGWHIPVLLMNIGAITTTGPSRCACIAHLFPLRFRTHPPTPAYVPCGAT